MLNKIKDTKRCKICGAPLLITREDKWGWRKNGTFVSAGERPNILISLDNLTAIFNELEEKLGKPIKKIISETKKQSTKRYVDGVISGFKGLLVRNRFLGEKAFEKMIRTGRAVGYGDIWIEKLEWGKILTMCVRGAYFLPELAGDVGGVTQSLWRKPVRINLEEKNGIGKIMVESALAEEEVAKHLYPSPVLVLPGNITYEICPGCKIPKMVSETFEWDWPKGYLIHRKTGKRWVLLGRHGFNSLLQTLERELGVGLSKLILDIEKKCVKSEMCAKKEFVTADLKGTQEDYQKLFNPQYFGLCGWGNPIEVEKREKVLGVKINNPFNDVILAGMIAGIYETIEGMDSEVQWAPNTQGYFTVTVSPKL